MRIKIIKTDVNDLSFKSKLPGVKYVINHYVGCEHACLYCYAKSICRKYKYGEWGTWVLVRENVPDLVKSKKFDGSVFMSSISDPYQPIERELKLTRKILENLNKESKVSILTKSDLVLRDIDLFKKYRNIEIGLTINSWDKEIKKELEPRSSENSKRIDALKILNENKIENYAFISPIIPLLTDLEAIIRETKDFVNKYWFEFLNFRAAGLKFNFWIKEKYPEAYEILVNKEKWEKFMEGSINLIKKFDIKVEGIVIHS